MSCTRSSRSAAGTPKLRNHARTSSCQSTYSAWKDTTGAGSIADDPEDRFSPVRMGVSLQFNAGVSQSFQSAKLPLALLAIFITPGELPVLVKNFWTAFFSGSDHSGRIEQ